MFGAGFAAANSGFEAFLNLREEWTFRTNIEALDHFRELDDWPTAREILYGLDKNWVVLPDQHEWIKAAEAQEGGLSML